MHVVDPDEGVGFGKTYYNFSEFPVDLIIGLPIFRGHKFKTMFFPLFSYLSVGETKLWKNG